MFAHFVRFCLDFEILADFALFWAFKLALDLDLIKIFILLG